MSRPRSRFSPVSAPQSRVCVARVHVSVSGSHVSVSQLDPGPYLSCTAALAGPLRIPNGFRPVSREATGWEQWDCAPGRGRGGAGPPDRRGFRPIAASEGQDDPAHFCPGQSRGPAGAREVRDFAGPPTCPFCPPASPQAQRGRQAAGSRGFKKHSWGSARPAGQSSTSITIGAR